MKLFVLAVFVLTLGVGASAQAPAAAPKAPTLDESDALAIQVVTLAGQLANTECQGLDAVKNYRTLQQQAAARFAKKYPAYSVDMGKGVLVPKVAAK